jgi:CheY-like chemotaxis protein
VNPKRPTRLINRLSLRRGTRFTVIFPINNDPSANPTSGSKRIGLTMPECPNPPGQTPARSVLVVDDDELVRMSIAEHLRDCGYTVLEAVDAREAMVLIDRTRSVDLVFSDVRMPGPVDGFALAHWLRHTHPRVQVVLTTGYSGAMTIPQDAGIRVIEKPYSQAQVARTIDELLGG